MTLFFYPAVVSPGNRNFSIQYEREAEIIWTLARRVLLPLTHPLPQNENCAWIITQAYPTCRRRATDDFDADWCCYS